MSKTINQVELDKFRQDGWSYPVDDCDERYNQLSEAKATLPMENGVVSYGIAGQFAVSDGQGGITWKTLVEAEEVSY